MLDSDEELKKQIKNLKRDHRGSFYTNYQLFNSDTNIAIDYTEIFSHVCENGVDIIRRDDDFYRLYYARGEGALNLRLPRSVENSVLVCDMIEVEGAEKQLHVPGDLYSQGFTKYKTFHLWECIVNDCQPDDEENTCVKTEENVERLAELYNYFDPYSDYLPMRKFFKRYCDSAEAVSYFSDEKYAAGIIYHMEGKTVTEDFIYVLNGFRGVGGCFQKAFLTRCRKAGVRKIYAWIEDKNVPSIRMHEKNGFVRTKQYKTTFLRNGEQP